MTRFVYKMIVYVVRAEFQRHNKDFEKFTALGKVDKAEISYIRMLRWHDVHSALIEARFGVVRDN